MWPYRVLYTLTPNLLSRIISFSPLVPDPLVTLKFLLWWGSPISAIAHAVSSACRALLPIFHLVKSCRLNITLLLWSLTDHPCPPWLAHTLSPCTPVALLTCDCVLCTLSCPPYKIKPLGGRESPLPAFKSQLSRCWVHDKTWINTFWMKWNSGFWLSVR